MTKGEYNARKLKIIKTIYDEIIQNYVELTRTLEFDNPVEVYSLYTKLLHKGFFSKTGHFIYKENDKMLDFNNFLGLDVINGNGVCRHFCSMLKDIYDELFFSNEILPIYFYGKEEDIERKHFFGNHVINIVEYNGISYFLDPSNSFIWSKVGKKILAAYKNNNLNVASFSYFYSWFLTINNYSNFQFENFKNIRTIMSIQHASLSDCIKLDTRVNKIYKNNLDIFEQLERENRILYSEINSNLSKMKIRRK